MLAIFKKELKVYFTSILGYVVMSIYLLVAVVSFYGWFLYNEQASSDFSAFFGWMNSFFLFILPLITMRSLAEEKNLGTYELLLTSPITPWQIVIGKFLGVFGFVLTAATVLLIFPISLSFFAEVELGPVLSGYIGMVFSLGFFVAVGVAASSVTGNQVIAAVIAYAVFFLLYLITAFSDVQVEFLARLFKELSFIEHYTEAAKGLIVLKDILYFIIASFIALYIAKTAVESKSWK